MNRPNPLVAGLQPEEPRPAPLPAEPPRPEPTSDEPVVEGGIVRLGPR